jgi:hypothetical protein
MIRLLSGERRSPEDGGDEFAPVGRLMARPRGGL